MVSANTRKLKVSINFFGSSGRIASEVPRLFDICVFRTIENKRGIYGQWMIQLVTLCLALQKLKHIDT